MNNSGDEYEREKDFDLISVWGTDVGIFVCEACDWSFLMPGEKSSHQCPHCFQNQLSPTTGHLEELPYIFPPELMLVFTLANEEIEESIGQFTRGIPFPPRDLTPKNLISRTRANYLPMWLVDVDVNASWSGEAGFNYEVVSHQDRYDDRRGGWKSNEVKETRTRWELRSGVLSRNYQNIPAPALEGGKKIFEIIGGFDLRKTVTFEVGALDNSYIRLPNRIPEDAWCDAKPHLLSTVSDDCRKAADADYLRQFTWNPEFNNLNWTLLLLPVISTYYCDDEGEIIPVNLHGQTGQISGRRYASKFKAQRTSLIILTISIILFIFSLLLALGSILLPVILVLGMLSFLISLLVGISSIIPIAMVWNFNRQHRTRNSI
jgi:hypothetical protein